MLARNRNRAGRIFPVLTETIETNKSPNSLMGGPLVSVPEAANLLRVSHWTIRAWLRTGKLARVKAGARTLVRLAALEEMLLEK
jgi:excisionase family DNA binding protein